MTIANEKMTVEQFFMLGEDPPGKRLELVDGAIAMSPSPSIDHSYADTELRYYLRGHIKKSDLGILLGDIDTIFDHLNVRRPDILFLAKHRLHLLEGHGVPVAPDLCVEILSPSSVTIDQVDKFKLYAKHGVTEYWIVDPMQRSMKGFHLNAGGYTPSGSGRNKDTIALPPFLDLSIPLGDLWVNLKK